MTDEEILKLMNFRFKVIRRYPRQTWAVGSVVELTDNGHGLLSAAGDQTATLSFFNDYPHLFERLEWWQERKQYELPQYLKNVRGVYYVDRYDMASKCFFSGSGMMYIKNYVPATEEEYIAYRTKKSA